MSCLNLDNTTIDTWRTAYNLSDSDLVDFTCSYSSYIYFRHRITVITGYTNLIFSVFGLLGACLTLFVLCKNSDFSSLCFFYFRVISVCEVFVSVVTAACSIFFVYPSSRRSFSLVVFIDFILFPCGSVFATCAECLVLFLSFERAVACLLPTKFYVLKNPKVPFAVVASSAVLSFLLIVPALFGRRMVRESTGYYRANWYQTELLQNYEIVVSVFMYAFAGLVAISSGLAIFGMIHSMKRRRRIVAQSDIRRRSSQSQGGDQPQNSSLQICYLQATQAVPMLFNYVFYAVHTVLISQTALVATGTGQKAAVLAVRSLYNNEIFWFLGYLTNDIAHCTHFYLYLLFSKNFRVGAKKRFHLS